MACIRITVFIGLLILISACSPRPDSKTNSGFTIPKTVKKFITNPSLENASVGILFVDLNSGENILDYNSTLSLVPASTLKILVSAAALETFGPDHQFITTLAYSGKISEGRTLNGNLLIKGDGDPAFLSTRFEKHYQSAVNDMVQEVQNMGIRWINGNIIGDGSYFGLPQIPDTWIWEDIGNYYGSPAFGLNIFDNTYTITFKTGKAGSRSGIINVEPEVSGLTFKNRVTAANNNRDNAYIYGSYLSNQRVISGTIPENRKSFSIKGSIPDPAFVAAHQLFTELKENGIGISGESISNYDESMRPETQTLIEIPSPPLSEIIEQLNMKSINLFAETMLLHLAKTFKKECSVEAGCESLQTFWEDAGMDISGLYLEDGSGLSRANAITAEQLVFVLQHMHRNKNRESFIRSLPVAGKSGTLKSFGKNTVLKDNLVAKSGYMSRVLNYTGYLSTNTGKDLAFALMVNNYNCTNSEMRKLMEELLISIFEKN